MRSPMAYAKVELHPQNPCTVCPCSCYSSLTTQQPTLWMWQRQDTYSECAGQCTALCLIMYQSHSTLHPCSSWYARSQYLSLCLCLCLYQVPAAVLQVKVQPCGIGQVPSADQNKCTLCPYSSYSFDPIVDDCKTCPTGASCIGGATLVPQQQYWHSAPDSDHIVTCPNNNACAGNTGALLACQNETYQASLDVDQVQLNLTPCMQWMPCMYSIYVYGMHTAHVHSM